MLVPGERVVDQRLADPEVIEPREPGGFGEEFVEANVAGDGERTVVVVAAQLDVSAFVLVRVQFALDVFLQEIAIALQADFGGELPIVWQLLAALLQQPAAVAASGTSTRRSRPRLSRPWS